MDCNWPLEQLNDQLCDIVEGAHRQGPQVLTTQGEKTAVVLAYADYQRLTAAQKKLSDFFRNSPLVGVDLDLSRGPSSG